MPKSESLRLTCCDRRQSNWDHPGWRVSFFLALGCFPDFSLQHECSLDTGLVQWRMSYFNYHTPEMESGYIIHTQTCIQRINFRFSRTMRDWSLFLTHPACGNECSTSKDIQNFPEVDLKSSKAPAMSESWNKCNLLWIWVRVLRTQLSITANM